MSVHFNIFFKFKCKEFFFFYFIFLPWRRPWWHINFSYYIHFFFNLCNRISLTYSIIENVVLLTHFFLFYQFITSILFQELMKITGVNEKLMWFSWFLCSMITGIFVYTVITFLLQINFHGPESAVIRVVQTSVLWTSIVLFFMGQISFCFMFCAIFNSSKFIWMIQNKFYVYFIILL